MKKCVAQIAQATALGSLLILSTSTTVEARRNHASQVQQRQPEPDPFAAFDKPAAQSQPSYQPPARNSAQHQPTYAPPQPQGPVWQPEKTPSSGKTGGKGDDGADQDDENDPEWYKKNALSYPCYKLAEHGLFNFEQMRNFEGDYEVTDTRGRQVSFNFCLYAESTSAGCTKDAFAFMKEGGKCLELTSDEPKSELNDYVERASTIKSGDQQEGIRLTRAGGANCPEDQTQLLGTTIDVWCNPEVTGSPTQISSPPKGPLDDDDADPCNIYITMEHADGCVVLDLTPFLTVLGAFMILSGVCLQWMGPKWQKSFMIFIVRLGTFLIVCSFAYERNYFAFFDPSEPPQNKDPVKAFGVIIFAFVAQWIVGYLFHYSIRLAPTLLGVYTGYYFAIYVIVAINGIGGAFESSAAAKATHDTIDPIMSYVYQAFGAFIGGVLGYCYSAAFIALVQTFLSAYLIVRGSTMFKNWGFPNEMVLMQSTSTEDNNLVKLPTAFYVYSFVILVLWFLFLRSHMRRREPENQKYLDEE